MLLVGSRADPQPVPNPHTQSRESVTCHDTIRGVGSGAHDRHSEPAGVISWDQHQWFGRPCWSLGVQLARSFRGRGVGTRVHQLVVAYLFAESLLNRIEAYTDAANIAERHALEKSGFTLEGTLRSACFRNGQWHDGVLYSIVR